VPTTRRERVLDAPPGRVWAVVADAHHQPRWWPRVTRVEGVAGGRFTQVLTTEAGRTVRADFRVVERDEGCRLAWEQDVEGTPFAGVLRAARTEVGLEPAGAGTRVRLTIVQQLVGVSRLGGGVVVRRATGRLLDEALDGLARAV
jgi:uncharacterized protein YndB with AHSA1/START domain